MAPKDADMPDHKALGEDLDEITKHLSNIRKEVDSLVRSIGATGTHQADHLQGQAGEMLTSVEDAVRREPLKAVGIALGAGFLLGVLRG
jgi:ElaB/YqjD/DUF883 family membrane-anchored ribosome-binding protein